MDLRIPDDQMRQLVTSAILQSLTPEHREKLLSGAIQSLISLPQEGRYGEKLPSTLTAIFAEQAKEVAKGMVKELIEQDGPTREKIRALLLDALERVFVTNHDKVAKEMAEAVEKAVCRIRDY